MKPIIGMHVNLLTTEIIDYVYSDRQIVKILKHKSATKLVKVK